MYISVFQEKLQASIQWTSQFPDFFYLAIFAYTVLRFITTMFVNVCKLSF